MQLLVYVSTHIECLLSACVSVYVDVYFCVALCCGALFICLVLKWSLRLACVFRAFYRRKNCVYTLYTCVYVYVCCGLDERERMLSMLLLLLLLLLFVFGLCRVRVACGVSTWTTTMTTRTPLSVLWCAVVNALPRRSQQSPAA